MSVLENGSHVVCLQVANMGIMKTEAGQEDVIELIDPCIVATIVLE